jgi:uncharacterized protein (DUF1697 family)
MTQAREADKMAMFVAFLRGINVGGHRKVPMADLRRLLIDITADPNVQTYIASGNAVFKAEGQADALASEIAAGIKTKFGFDVPMLVLDEGAMRTVLAECPCPDEKGNLAHAYLCYDNPKIDHASVEALRVASENVTVVGRTVWLHAPDGVGRSKLAAKMEKLIGVEATARNLNTVKKMVEMLRE